MSAIVRESEYFFGIALLWDWNENWYFPVLWLLIMQYFHFHVSQFSCSAMSDSLWPHGLQHTRLLCPSPTPEAYSNSHPLSRWYHPTISSSAVPISSYLQSYLASGSFLMSQFFASGDQSIGASASVVPMNIQDCFPLRNHFFVMSVNLSALFPHPPFTVSCAINL